MELKIGDRVLASLNGTGVPRPGVISGVMHLPGAPVQYAVTFEGDDGWTMPCVAVKEAV